MPHAEESHRVPSRTVNSLIPGVGTPIVRDEGKFLELTREILRSGHLTNNGKTLRSLEEAIAAYLGVPHCIAVSSCTTGLQLATRALGLSGEVITTPFTFCATYQALIWCGLTPVFVDIDPVDHNIDPIAVERAITPRTSGILGVHIWGRPCKVKNLERIACEHNLRLFFDAAHAFGSSVDSRRVGAFGSCEIFSFHATKLFQCFEGGAILTSDAALADCVRQMRDHGHAIDGTVSTLGMNGKMSEIHAAMGLANLPNVDDEIRTRQKQHAMYAEKFAEVPGLTMRPPRSGENCQYAVVSIASRNGVNARDWLFDALQRQGVGAKRYFRQPLHKSANAEGLSNGTNKTLSVAGRAFEETLVLPSGSALADSDINLIAALVVEALESCDER